MQATATPLVLVTGKGGTGKTSVAAALALADAQRGERTLLVHMGGGDGAHPVFDHLVTPAPAEVSPGLWVARLDARLALKEYLRRRTTFGRVYERVVDNPAVARLVDALPAFDELMSLGKLYDLVTDAATPFTRVVFDAPATGHFRTLLRVPGTTVDALAGGPIRHSARRIQDLLVDPKRTRVVVVALPEEAPVQEALELIEFADSMGVARAPVVLNRMRAARFEPGELEPLRASTDAGVARLLEALEADEAVAMRHREHASTLAQVSELVEVPEVLRDTPLARARALQRVLAGGMS